MHIKRVIYLERLIRDALSCPHVHAQPCLDRFCASHGPYSTACQRQWTASGIGESGRTPVRGLSLGGGKMIFLPVEKGDNGGAQGADRDKLSVQPTGAQLLVETGRLESLALMASALRFIEDNLRCPMTAEGVARHVGCSTRQLNRYFREWLAHGPARMLIVARMARAAMLLRATDSATKEICAEVGVPWVGSFGRLFRRVHGISPAKYRFQAGQACPGAREMAGIAKPLAEIAKT